MKNEKGFSIVELLIAIFLLTIGLLSVAGMQTTAINYNSWANKLSTATALAQEAMEDLLARDSTAAVFQANSTNNTYDFDLATAGIQNTINIPGAGTFTATYNICANNPAAGVATIIVAVTDGGGIVTVTCGSGIVTVVTVTGGSRTVTITSYKRAV